MNPSLPPQTVSKPNSIPTNRGSLYHFTYWLALLMPSSPERPAGAPAGDPSVQSAEPPTPAPIATPRDSDSRPRIRSAPPQNHSSSPARPVSQDYPRRGLGQSARPLPVYDSDLTSTGANNRATSPRRPSDPRVASRIDAPLQSSRDDGDDDCLIVADHPAASDSGGRNISRIGSSVTSRESRADPRSGIGKRRQRGPLETTFSKRFRALRPCGTHPGLGSWDCLPYPVRSSLAGQERGIFSVSGLLVCRVDLQLYQLLREHQPQQLRAVFPRAPSWWPVDWGRIPICLPWEISFHRGRLVEAADNAAIWYETYQLFLQQLAAGWDLEWTGADGNGVAHQIPKSLAEGIIDAGGFAFLPARSGSLPKFLSLHGIPEHRCPPQRDARSRAWGVIRQAAVMTRPLSQGVVSPQLSSSASPSGALKSALQGSRLSDLVTDLLGGAMHLNLERPDVLCAFSAGAARVIQKVEGIRKKAADLLASVVRDSDPEYFHVQLEQLAGSLPVASSYLTYWFHKSIEDIRAVSDIGSLPVVSPPKRD